MIDWIQTYEVARIVLAVERGLAWCVCICVLLWCKSEGIKYPRYLARWVVVPCFVPAWLFALAWRYGWPRKARYGAKHTDEPRARDGMYR